jgi:hypothetical protein
MRPRPADEKMWFREQAEHSEFVEVIRLLIEKGGAAGMASGAHLVSAGGRKKIE